jgi:hypothetical protein
MANESENSSKISMARGVTNAQKYGGVASAGAA